MKPATAPGAREAMKLVAIDSVAETIGCVGDLPSLLSAGDVVVVNDAATFPGSLQLEDASGELIELRVFRYQAARADAVAFGAGDWRVDTTKRPQPPPLRIGDELAADGSPIVRVVSARGRLVTVEFIRSDALTAIMKHGTPIQYSYLRDPLELWSVQTVYSSRPVAAEMPSAGRALTWALIDQLRERGVELARVTHAAGLSSTGDPALDRTLPFPEWYEVPADTVAAINRAKRAGRRIVAIGTTVVRALESAASTGWLVAGSGIATLRIGPNTELRVVDSILTGLHERDSSHWQLLGAFAPPASLEAGWKLAASSGFRAHEFGDVALISPRLNRSWRHQADRDRLRQRAPRRSRRGRFRATRSAERRAAALY